VTARANTLELAQGKWRGILGMLGVASSFLTGKHGPCPICDGKDRFRFDDKDGRGTYHCSGCGAGTGMQLLQRLNGWDFKTAASEVDKIIGEVTAEKVKPALDDAKRVELLRSLWSSGLTASDGDPIARYLASRGLPLPQNRQCLRYVDRCRAPEHCGGGIHPAIVAMITDADGKPATLHRTFLGPNGKADIEDPRATMPGLIPDGAAIRLSMHGERLGIAEGIETALAASVMFDMPVWAAINSTMLSKWKAPEHVREVVVFGDNDTKFGGAAAAYALAHRLVCRDHLAVDVRIPDQVGADWADVHARTAKQEARA
jgi:putative DNA primase/helicase